MKYVALLADGTLEKHGSWEEAARGGPKGVYRVGGEMPVPGQEWESGTARVRVVMICPTDRKTEGLVVECVWKADKVAVPDGPFWLLMSDFLASFKRKG